MPLKEFQRGRIEKRQKEGLAHLQAMMTHRYDARDGKVSWPLLPHTIARLNKDFRMNLLHCYCTMICKQNLVLAEKVTALDNAERLTSLMNVFPRDLQALRL